MKALNNRIEKRLAAMGSDEEETDHSDWSDSEDVQRNFTPPKSGGITLNEAKAYFQDNDSENADDLEAPDGTGDGSELSKFFVGDASTSQGSDSINNSTISNSYHPAQEDPELLIVFEKFDTVYTEVAKTPQEATPSVAPESAYKPGEPTSTPETEFTTTPPNGDNNSLQQQ